MHFVRKFKLVLFPKILRLTHYLRLEVSWNSERWLQEEAKTLALEIRWQHQGQRLTRWAERECVAIANSYNSGCKEGRRKRDTSSSQPTTTSKGPHQTRSSTGYLRELLDRHRDIVRRHRAFFIAVSQFYQYYETAANCTPASIVMLAVLCQRQQGKLRPHTNGTTTGGHIT